MSESEAWRHAAREVSGLGKSTTQFREDVADAAVRVALEYLRNDGGAWLTIEGAEEVDRLSRAMPNRPQTAHERSV